MISAGRAKAARRTSRRKREGGAIVAGVSWQEIWLADELSRCLEDVGKGRSLRSVVSTLKRDAVGEIAPLLEIAEMLRQQKYALLQVHH